MAQGYARTYQAQAVLSASPGRLVLMLYDGTLRFLGHARDALQSPESTPRRIEIIKAQNILVELQATLNHEAGGDHSANLDRLYDYYMRRLLEANIKKIVEPVIEVEALVRQLRDGWAEMLCAHETEHELHARGVA